ncbi:hypothetical protein SJAG_02179 [Schizosaccharomyces japonicus yFS275]|uniref:Queuosine 5'-phosphate N-glycosylase/hydrolase n=1 Tax=Schizosaccharomyces japonicus (strain yFS275 / FY16936) TaxID=402676 RepID=B6K1R7_SCHJY|nr:hypothetical protein SJAG_02179 [Schizosaccharomyces japonicus yFS275]EEB07098.1 hypothetical protein SJAG_02179 [Schizosaccharomyces japonicus yFS275]
MPPKILEQVRNGATDAFSHMPDFSFNAEAAKELSGHLEKLGSDDGPVQFPLAFESVEEKVNFLAIYALLSFGSGFRKELHEFAQRGAQDTTLFLAMTMYMTKKPGLLDADFLSNVTVSDIAEWAGVPLRIEKPCEGLSSSAITELVDSDLKPWVENMAHVLVETGTILKQLDCQSLGAFCLEYANPNDSNELVERLCMCFPAFQDVGRLDGQLVYILKKAMLAVYMLHNAYPDRFSCEGLSVFADNVLPSILVYFHVLEIPESLRSKLENLQPLTDKEALQLRTATVHICNLIANETNISPVKIDQRLWKYSKSNPELRKLPRFLKKDTVMF